MQTMYVPGSVIHVHSSYIIWTSLLELAPTARRPTRMNGGDNRDTCSGANSSVDV
jgi:hypothetical protein